jgi:hypothetical protein
MQGYLQSHLQEAFRKFEGRYNDLVCQYNLPLGQMLSEVFYTNCWAIFDTLILTTVCTIRLPDLDLGFRVGVTSRQGMRTPPRHLIPPLICPEVRVCPILWLFFLWDLWDWWLFFICAISWNDTNDREANLRVLPSPTDYIYSHPETTFTSPRDYIYPHPETTIFTLGFSHFS